MVRLKKLAWIKKCHGLKFWRKSKKKKKKKVKRKKKKKKKAKTKNTKWYGFKVKCVSS